MMFRNEKHPFRCTSISLCEFRILKYKNIEKLKETWNKITKKCLVLGFFWWAGVDSDHRSQVTTDLQSVPFGRSGTYPYMELAIGIEPTTCWLQVSCSANWATPAILLKKWCLRAESNHRQRDFQSLALPTELPRHLRFALNTRLRAKYGDLDGDRTHDL